jgi:ATP-dependent helicase/nuclease subunit B
MRLVFEPDFDFGSWPGPLAACDAVTGEEWVGQAGLLSRLELALGLGGPETPGAERAAALVPQVLSVQGFWSESATRDPLGTARRLLAWRDELYMGGWTGAAFTSRLAQLAEVTATVAPGFPDRLASVTETLTRRRADIEQVELLIPPEELPHTWRAVLAGLERRGTAVREIRLPEILATQCDLHAARAAPFHPGGDGSLQLLRPYGSLAAAEIVAAWLAALPDLAGALVIGPDTTLDAALHRHGLPTTGATAAVQENLLLQVLPLALALAWHPPDPQRALELLTLPIGPVPQPIAGKLVRALHEWPAVDSDAWRTALVQGLAALPEGDRRAGVERRLEALFSSSLKYGSPYPSAEAERRIAVLETWLRGRRWANEGTSEETKWEPPLAQLASTRRLLGLSGLSEHTAPQLQWLVEAATEAVGTPPVLPAEAGLAAVGVPGAVAGPARTIVWWNFTLEAAPPMRGLPLSAEERAALAAAGVELLDPGREALRRARRWRRPLFQASEHLLLIAPRRGRGGEEAFPHPLWDELAARIPTPAARSVLEFDRPHKGVLCRTRPGVARPTPKPVRDWIAPARLLVARDAESPSSLRTLLGCSFKWSLDHVARLSLGETGALPSAELLAGRLAHEILRRALAKPASSPAEVRALAETLFDEEGPRLAAPLFLPGADDPHDEARHVISQAASTLTGILHQAGLRLVSSEKPLMCTTGRWKDRLGGIADLVVGPPATVLDLKWGPFQRRLSLESGTALQLACYSIMLREGPQAPLPAVAYFVLKTQQLLTTAAGIFLDVERIEGRTVDQTWAAFEVAHDTVRQDFLAGDLVAPGNPDDEGNVYPEEEEIAEDGRLVLMPPCRFCELSVLCGRVFGGQRS